jgi:hypothetical protein
MNVTEPSSIFNRAPPKVFTTGSVLVLYSFILLRAVPVLVSLAIVSLMRLQLLSFLIPPLALVVTVYFLPLGLGNPYVGRLARPLRTEAARATGAVLVQLTVFPRIRSGLRAFVEDADDIGFLRVTESHLVFEGDSLRLILPFHQISEVHPQNVGWRGSFVYGRRIELSISGVDQVEGLEFAERSSWVLPTSKRLTRELYQKLTEKVPSARSAD